ncbi:MAG: hypothetical protein EPO21_15335 [Chloroflexota bacterium]|nr:MAG: hypothetical protein EPO21_15335 [Chloroflexota bacterium]
MENEAHTVALQTQAAEQRAREDAHALDVMGELRRAFQRINLLFDACDRWLRDPDNQEQYTLDPRSEDVSVVYAEPNEDGKPVRKKARLSALLAQLAKDGVMVQGWETKHADPRELVLKTAAQLEGQTELLAKLLGELDERPQVNVLLAPEWQAMRATLVDALSPFPDARSAVADALVKLEAGANGHRR